MPTARNPNGESLRAISDPAPPPGPAVGGVTPEASMAANGAGAPTRGSGSTVSGKNTKPKGRKAPKLFVPPTWWARFFAHFCDSGNVRFSAKAAGVSRENVYQTAQRHPEFAHMWISAKEDAIEALEAEARKRATMGQSDTLLIFLLKSLRPDVYRENVHIEVNARREAKRLAHEQGLSEEEVLAEVDKILKGSGA